jgi:hypothetical protein
MKILLKKHLIHRAEHVQKSFNYVLDLAIVSPLLCSPDSMYT